ncbi:unnamed protein product [Nyctereutes procyonoides]|uniref:ATP synthase lipid-binding protein n=1 Tax=Nyctereutes procyonoides TaxID=34880 RepID=A0A811YYW2_NYCPR|nr:unnamed protein product [Nyctereutes procyonoides]
MCYHDIYSVLVFVDCSTELLLKGEFEESPLKFLAELVWRSHILSVPACLGSSPRSPLRMEPLPLQEPPLSCSRAAQNPSLKQQLFSYAILSFALLESMGLFCLMVAFLILFAM